MKTYTEKQVAVAQREAFVAGSRYHGGGGCMPRETAEYRFPMPKITRPREVKVSGNTYRIVDGKIEWRNYGDWINSAFNDDLRIENLAKHSDDLEVVRALVELYKNPTETVDA
jgi:hypothetical protein